MGLNDFTKDSELMKMPTDSSNAITFIVEVLLNHIHPLISRISNILHNCSTSEVLLEENVVQIRYVYTLCSDQVKKCIITLIDIVKLENHHKVILQESRNCTLERLSWCYNKLLSIEELLIKRRDDINFDDPIFASTMYFVNWIDQTFDLLNKLSTIVYKTDIKEKEELFCQWKSELVENVCGLHTSIDELLLCAMTLCKYCLPVDQPIIRARCQVVMRETKALITDLIDGDLHTVKATTETLKLPIKPSNINVLIDVLKDVLYVLETNTNTALLALVIHCFSQNMSPADMLKGHFEKRKETCTCCKNGDDEAENCKFIKEFDLHNERLLQIGSFAMSCSSDQKRILSLRGGLASLEALDPHLVPAVMMSPQSHHSSILINIWNQEVKQIRNGIFLIVDPAAFADKVKQMMHQKLLEITKDKSYDNVKSCTVINMGCVLVEFFQVYNELEPDALSYTELLTPLLQDLDKVQMECKIVSNLLCEEGDYTYDVTRTQKHTVSFEQLLKRLKLLYTLIKKINNILNPAETDEFYEEPDIKNITQTVHGKNGNTYVHSPRKITNNITRSIFARTNLRSSTGRFPLAALTKHLKIRNDLNFSIQLDEICNISEIKLKNRETSILYQTPMKTRSSLRKAVLNKHCVMASDKDVIYQELETSTILEQSLIEDSSLQITDVLNQINDLTCSVSTPGRRFDTTILVNKSRNIFVKPEDNGVKRIWDNSVTSVGDCGSVSNVTQPSDVDTLDRINDLDLVEIKLSDLKSGQIETSL